MDARLDTPFEIWGRFSEKTDAAPLISGRLTYEPEKGIQLELVEKPEETGMLNQVGAPDPRTLYGELVDGTLVTLSGCYVTKSSFHIPSRVASPTELRVLNAFLGRQFVDVDNLRVKEYSQEFSSLANWSGAKPLKWEIVKAAGEVTGLDSSFRIPTSICVDLPGTGTSVELWHWWKWDRQDCSHAVGWGASISIKAKESISFDEADQVSGQCKQLVSLLVGRHISVRSVSFLPAPAGPNGADVSPLRRLFKQRGRHDHPNVHPAEMMLPYALLKDEFASVVQKWFARSEQAVLATNVFFGSQLT